MLLLKQMCVLFAIMLIGLYAYKKSIIDDASCKKLSGIVVKIANPALVLSSITGDTRIPKDQFFKTFLTAVLVYAVLLVLAKIVPMLLRVKRDEQGVYKAMIVFSNIGFMGFPVVNAVYGPDALLYASLFMIPYNVLIYTYGISAMRHTEEKKGMRELLRSIFNVGTVFCCIAIALYLFDVHIPEVPAQIIDTLGGLTAPLSMMVIGACSVIIISNCKYEYEGTVHRWKADYFLCDKAVTDSGCRSVCSALCDYGSEAVWCAVGHAGHAGRIHDSNVSTGI